VKRDKEIVKDRANPLLAEYLAGLLAVRRLDIIGVERVKNLEIFFPAAADIGCDDGGIQDPFPCV
jgi:hypothetical protein